MTIDMFKQVKESIGYKNIITGLNEVFQDNYEIIEIIPSEDDTSYDFRTVINIIDSEGIDIGVTGSGSSHQFQIGDGILSIGVPVENAFFRLPSGKSGEALSQILKDKGIKFGASANDLEQIKNAFLTLKMYLEGSIK